MLSNISPVRFVSDKQYLKCDYRIKMGHKLNLKDPKRFNEKLQWLKLYNRNPFYNIIVDKYAVREYIKEKIGDEYLIPLLGVWDKIEDVDYSKLPEQFVLKGTNDCGSVMICSDRKKFDFKKAKYILKRATTVKYYYTRGREWAYKDVQPRIIAEKFMVDESGYELKDYKFFCFNGEPKMIQVNFDRFNKSFDKSMETKKNLYDTEWNFLPFVHNYPSVSEAQIARPERLEDMLELARTLSKGFPFLRVDFYYINGRIYFGELTLYPASGYGAFTPDEWDYTLGSWIDLDLAYSRRK